MKKTTEKRIAKWINRFVDREKSKAAWRYRNQNPKIKTLKEAMEKMPDEYIRYPVTLYPFYNEVEDLTVYTNGHLVIQVKGKVEGINYYEGNELKPFDYYSRLRKLFKNLDDYKSRVELYLPEIKKLKEYIKYIKKTYNAPCCGYNFGKGKEYPLVNAEYLLAMMECVDQNCAVGALDDNVCQMIATEDNDVLFVLMPIMKRSYNDTGITNLEKANRVED